MHIISVRALSKMCFQNLYVMCVIKQIESKLKQNKNENLVLHMYMLLNASFLRAACNTVKVVIFARSYFRDLPIFNCFACF